jgi:hypothetical protein
MSTPDANYRVYEVPEQVDRLLRIRLLVGFLGERAQFRRWESSFFAPSSARVLQYLVPSTVRMAQVHGAVEAARRVHDEVLSQGMLHLFRLPEEWEQDLHRALRAGAGGEFPVDRDAALDELGRIGADRDDPDAPWRTAAGPCAVGAIDSPSASQALAAAWHSAFRRDVPLLPYLTEPRS